MPIPRSLSGDVSPRHPSFICPPRHLLFAVFDSFERAAAAAARLRLSGRFSAADDIWLLEGEEGLQILDVSGAAHGFRGLVVCFFELGFAPNDVDYLRRLAPS